jgi:uncharacterized protein
VALVRSRPEGERVEFHLDTNGVLIDAEIAHFLVDEKFNIQFSLDGPREIHDRYRRTRSGEGSHDRTIAAIEHLLELDRECADRINFNAVMAPPYDVARVVEYFADFAPYKKFGITEPPDARIDFADLTYMEFVPRDVPEGEAKTIGEEIAPLRQQYMEYCRDGRYGELSPALRSFFDPGIIGFYHRPRNHMVSGDIFVTGTCQPGQRKIHVRADGSLLPCERGGDHMFIGHITTGIDLPAVENLYRKLIDSVADRCHTCWAIRRCSACFIHMSTSWAEDGKGEITVPVEVCENTRETSEIVFREFLSLQKAGPQAMEWLKETRIT